MIMRGEIIMKQTSPSCLHSISSTLGSLITLAAITSTWLPVINSGPLTRHLSHDLANNEVTNNSLGVTPAQVVHHSCRYQGSVYSYDEDVPTDEPCLVCQCKSAVVCKLRICEELPSPPPPGCIVVHKAKECCAELICDSQGGETQRKLSRENRLSPRNNASLPEPRTGLDKAYCVLDGTVYAEGSAMRSSSLCEYCFCIRGEMKCSRPQCIIPMNGCKPRFRSYACCPTNYDCHSSNATAVLQTIPSVIPVPEFLKGCSVQGKRIREGEPVLALEIGNHTDPCQTCFCMGGTVRCRPLECDRAIEGCKAIKEDGHCCPDRYKCDNGSKSEDHLKGDKVEKGGTASMKESSMSLHDTNLLSRQMKPGVDGLKAGLSSETQVVETESPTEIYTEDGSTIRTDAAPSTFPSYLLGEERGADEREESLTDTTLPSEVALEKRIMSDVKRLESSGAGVRAERRNKERGKSDEVDVTGPSADAGLEDSTVRLEEMEKAVTTGDTSAFDGEASQTTRVAETTQGVTGKSDVDETTTMEFLMSKQVGELDGLLPDNPDNIMDAGRTEVGTSTPRLFATTTTATNQLQGENNTALMEVEGYGMGRAPLEASLPQALIDYRGDTQNIEGETTKLTGTSPRNTPGGTEPALTDTKITVSEGREKLASSTPESVVSNVHFISFGPEDALPIPTDDNRRTMGRRPAGPSYDHHALRLSLIPPSMPITEPLGMRNTGRLSSGNHFDGQQGRESKVAVLTRDDFRNAIMDVPVSTSLYSNGYYRNGYIVEDSYDPSELEVRTSVAFPGEVFDDKDSELEERSPHYSSVDKTSDKLAPQPTQGPSPPVVMSDQSPSRTHSKFGMEDSPLHRAPYQNNDRTVPAEDTRKESEPAAYMSFLELSDQRNRNGLKANSEMASDENNGSEQVGQGEDENEDHYDSKGEEEDDEEEETEEAASPEIDPKKDQYFYGSEYTTQGKTTVSPPRTTPITKYVFPQRRPTKKNSSTLIPDTHQISRVGAFGGFKKESSGKDGGGFRPAVAIPFSFPKGPGFNLGLKLSGCNIYGKMYNVGNVIPELSSLCGRCLCTEVGVHCSEVEC